VSADPVWFQALPLVERLAALRERPGEALPEAAAARAARRLERWQAQKSLAGEGRFERRLAAEGLTRAELLRLLGEPPEALAARHPHPPAWMAQLEEALARTDAPADLPLGEAQGLSQVEFVALAGPLIAGARERVRAGARRLAELHGRVPFSPQTVDGLCAGPLPGRLLAVMNRTLVLELNVARLQGQLEGETGEARYHSFIRRLRQREVAGALLREYPVLARQLLQTLDLWVDAHVDLLRRLCEDLAVLVRTFSPEQDPGALVGVEGGLGDSHRGGRSVCVLRFASGLRVVYKPKSLAVDQHFQALLAWLNARGDGLPLRTLAVVDRGTYGWTEFAGPGACASQEEVRHFYTRQGSLLAVLHLLLATDAHYENLIAAGGHPVFIDTESLFHSHFVKVEPGLARGQAQAMVSTSVLRVGMLPRRSWAHAGSSGVDYSALGARSGQLSPRASQYMEGAGTDGMYIARRPQVLTMSSHHLPRLEGQEVGIPGHEGALVEGFTRMYRLLLAHREALGAPGGPLACFADDEVRAILRPTHLYSLLLRESYHPDLLRDGLDREAFFDRLWALADDIPYVARLIPAERADLWRGDIPMFTTRPGSRDAWTSTGERLPEYFPVSGLGLVRERLGGLSEEDLQRQQWFIQASLATLGEETERGGSAPSMAPGAPVDRERLLSAARAVGARLEALAVRGEREAWWVGMVAMRERSWAAAPLGLELHSGLAGIALFLAWLAELTGDERPQALARAAVVSVRHALERGGAGPAGIGGFTGRGGLLYALAHLGALWNEPALLDLAERLAEGLEGPIAQDAALDVMGGAAGCLASLLALHTHRPHAPVLAQAVRCGERLLAQAAPMPQGLGWVTPLAPRPLTGFAHGAAGIAWALGALAERTGEPRFREAAAAALGFERGQFVPEAGNWRDLRERGAEEPPSFMVSWCQGAPGIGLGRLGLLHTFDTPEVRQEVATAVRTTLAQGLGRSHCLCHGQLGNLELLSLAAARLPEPGLAEAQARAAAQVLEGIEAGGWRCGTPRGMELPGLMTGLAGIGYGLLRLAAPARVPSVLMLETPPRR
jgi:type 2 lantibiotic biosynthesis protein LanM